MKLDKKVGIISPFPPPYGGMAVQAEKLAELLETEGIKVEKVQTNVVLSGCFKWVENIPLLKTIVRLCVFLSRLNRCISEVDCFYFLTGFFNFFFWVTLPGIILIKLQGKKFILNARGGGAADFFQRWKYIVLPFIRSAEKITTPSGFLKDAFTRHLGLEPKIIPNIADLDQFKFRKRAPFEPRFIVTRNLEEIYNVECVIKAFQKICKIIPESRLDVLGDGSLRKELEEKTQKWGLEQSVIFHGAIPHSKIQEYYQKNDIFLNASNVDNLPGTILEAYACGLPVISTNAGGIPYMVEDGITGQLVEKNDHAALAEKALFLLENQEKAAELVRNAAKECERYSAKSLKKQLVSLFLSLENPR